MPQGNREARTRQTNTTFPEIYAPGISQANSPYPTKGRFDHRCTVSSQAVRERDDIVLRMYVHGEDTPHELRMPFNEVAAKYADYGEEDAYAGKRIECWEDGHEAECVVTFHGEEPEVTMRIDKEEVPAFWAEIAVPLCKGNRLRKTASGYFDADNNKVPFSYANIK